MELCDNYLSDLDLPELNFYAMTKAEADKSQGVNWPVKIKLEPIDDAHGEKQVRVTHWNKLC